MLYLPSFGFISNGIWLEVIVPCKIIVFSMILPCKIIVFSMILPWNIIVVSIVFARFFPERPCPAPAFQASLGPSWRHVGILLSYRQAINDP